jgi:hypothetical protein
MPRTLDIVGIGDLTYDHVFSEEKNDDLLYLDSRGGGCSLSIS